MSEEGQVRIRRSRLIQLVWLLPIAAFLTVVWIGVHTFSEEGPTITITFLSADGLEAGHTKIRHKNVDIGTVKTVSLTPDLSRVEVTAEMDEKVASHVTTNSRFWIVRPRVSPAGISGLGTLVSGAYIEMDPGTDGEGTDHFVGLEEPPVVDVEDVPGTRFTLHASDLGSVDQGSPVYFRGFKVGEVLGASLSKEATHADVIIYVRAPYDRLVHPESHFWNVSGLAISAGAGGLRANTRSLEALVAGGISFETSDTALAGAPSPKNAEFTLFNDQDTAEEQPQGAPVNYIAYFPGTAQGVTPGAAVVLMGMRIGLVTDVHLNFDPANGTLRAPVTIEIDPKMLPVALDVPESSADVVNHTLDRLVAQGLRAKLASGNILTGQRLVSLEFVPDASSAKIQYDGPTPELPTVNSADLTSLTASAGKFMDKLAALPIAEIGASLHDVISHIDQATSGPELARSMKSLDRTLANLDQITQQANKEIGPTLESLHRTADAAQQTLEAAQRLMGSGGDRSRDLPAMIHELTDAARSIRALTDYLDQHPEALLRGRAAP